MVIYDVTALLGARNRYALRLADQSGLRYVVRAGTAEGREFTIYNLQLIVCYLYLGDLEVIG